MKNPRSVYVRNTVKEGTEELVKFVGFITHVDTKATDRTRICFKSDTQDKDSPLVSVDAWHSENGPDWRDILGNAKGRWCVVLATKSINNKNGVEYTNYHLDSIDMAPVPKN